MSRTYRASYWDHMAVPKSENDGDYDWYVEHRAVMARDNLKFIVKCECCGYVSKFTRKVTNRKRRMKEKGVIRLGIDEFYDEAA